LTSFKELTVSEAVLKNPGVYVTGIALFCNFIMVFITFIYVPSFLAMYSGLPPEQVSILSFIFYLMGFPSSIAVGIIHAKLKLGSPLAAIGLLLNAVGTIAMLYVKDFTSLLICIICIGWSNLWPSSSCLSIAGTIVPPKFAGTSVGVVSCLGFVGGCVGSFVGGMYMIARYGFPAGWWLICITSLIGLCFAILDIRFERRALAKASTA